MIIADYSLHEKIGAGAFSEVYRATRAGHVFALKLMKLPTGSLAGVEAAAIIESMRYEFWVLKDCRHPNLVGVHDFGALPDGRIYLVEDFLQGEDLSKFCQHRSFAECESVLLQILDGLAALHGWNVLHGDLKPHNIIVVNASGTWQAKILDFGLARAMERGTSHSTQIVGTPGTLAPEMILGKEPDTRTDLYSLGVTFYAALTGQNPFACATLTETMRAHLKHIPESIGILRADVPPRWQDFITHLLAKDREMRPTSAITARAQLSGAGFALVPTTFVGRKVELAIANRELESAWKSNQCVAVIARGMEGAGVTRFLREVYFNFLACHPAAREHIAFGGNTAQMILLDTSTGATEADIPQQTHRMLKITIANFNFAELGVWLEKLLHLHAVPAEFVSKIFSLSNGRPRLVWEVLEHLTEKELLAGAGQKIARPLLFLIDWERVLPGTKISVDVHEHFTFVLEELHIRLRRREKILVDPLWQKIATLIHSDNDGKSAHRRAQVLILGGACRIDAGELAAAREDLKSALALLEGDSTAPLDRIRARNYLAHIELRQQEVAQAVALYEESAREMEQQLSPAQVREITNLDLGRAYLAASRHDEAIRRLSAELLQAEECGNSAAQLSRLYHLAVAHFEKSEIATAAGYFRRTIELARNLHDGAYLLRAMNGLGNVLRRTDEWEEAVQSYSEAFDLALALKDPLSAAVAVQNRGGLQGAHGRSAEARRDLEMCLHQMEGVTARYAYEKGVIARALVQLGELEAQSGHVSAARACFDRAWHMAVDDAEMLTSRFRILYARCRLAISEKNEKDFDRELGLLNHYADDDAKRKKVAELRAEHAEARTGNVAVQPREEKSGVDYTRADSTPSSEITALLHITRELTGEMGTAELLRRILAEAIQLAHAELGVLLLVDADGELAPYLSLNADLSEDLSAISLSVARQALSQAQPAITADALGDSSFNSMASVIALKLRSILGLPICFKGKVLGVLYLSHRYRAALFDKPLVRLLSAFADLAATAMENHRLLEFHRRAENELRHELEHTQADLLVAREMAKQQDGTYSLRLAGSDLLTRSPVLSALLEQAERIAASPLSVVINGESGSGKELLARFLHAKSLRRDGPFVAINCGAIPQNLVESELFGHVRGTFTGATADRIGLIEAANSGTLFLDEITDLPLAMQVKLLRVLQEREVVRLGEARPRPVDVRIIAASHKTLKAAMARGDFREDLYYRLAGVELTLPPLRDRREDIPLLAEYFLNAAVKRAGKNRPARLAAGMLRRLCDYDWPGNVRELVNVMEVGAALCNETVLTLAALPLYLRERLAVAARPATPAHGGIPATGWYDSQKTWQEHEQLLFASALLALDFDIPRVAKSLGVGAATVYKKLRELRVRELERDWRARMIPYTEGLSRSSVRAEIFAQSFRRHPGHPYHVARELDVAPVTAYRYAPQNDALSRDKSV